MVRVLFSLMFTYFPICCISIKFTSLDLISILFFDSLHMHNEKIIARDIRKWLNYEWNRLPISEAENFTKKPFNAKSMVLKSPEGKNQPWNVFALASRF